LESGISQLKKFGMVQVFSAARLVTGGIKHYSISVFANSALIPYLITEIKR
jgi:hypothetical protein